MQLVYAVQRLATDVVVGLYIVPFSMSSAVAPCPVQCLVTDTIGPCPVQCLVTDTLYLRPVQCLVSNYRRSMCFLRPDKIALVDWA